MKALDWPGYIPVREMAAETGRSDVTIRRYMDVGLRSADIKLPYAVKFGNRYSKIEDWEAFKKVLFAGPEPVSDEQQVG